jgi:hypothetical protein
VSASEQTLAVRICSLRLNVILEIGRAMQGAVSSEDCELLSKALDHAWAIFLKSLRLDRHNHDIAKPALVYGILDALKDGVRNPRRLAASLESPFPNQGDH